MQPSKMTIEGLFNSQIRYIVPMFQRKYVWQEDPQWQNLWEDIEEKVDFRIKGETTHPHYLGALIVDGVKKVGNEVGRMLVIDGQQRLTTLQLLLCAFRDLAVKNRWSALDKRLSRLLENPDQDIMDEPDVEKFKVWPTTLNRDVFSGIVVARDAETVSNKFPIIKLPRKRKPETRSNLVEGYFYFGNRIEGWLNEAASKFGKSTEDCAQNLLNSLNESFFVIHLSLEDSDDAQEIFYSLNSKATPLSQSDLMRSLIFMTAEKEKKDKDKIFADYWSKLETDYWSYEIRRGGRQYSRLEIGMRHFLTAKTGQLLDARRISEEYRQWITVEPPRYENIVDELSDLIAHCEYFRKFDSAPSDLPSTDFKRVVRDLDASTAMPLVQFIALESGLSESQQNECFQIIESFLIRRAIVGAENKEYNKLFPEVVGTLSGSTRNFSLAAGRREVGQVILF
jgi:hypothetical protein